VKDKARQWCVYQKHSWT